MNKKSFVIISILSVIVTYGLGIMDALVNSSTNQAGLPFKFGSYVLFGTANTNYSILTLDIILWFFVIWGIWKIIQKISKRKK